MITGRQIRNGRALLGWQRSRLAKRAALAGSVVDRAESAPDESPITVAQATAIRQALETAGVEFIPENGGGARVRLRKVDPKT